MRKLKFLSGLIGGCLLRKVRRGSCLATPVELTAVGEVAHSCCAVQFVRCARVSMILIDSKAIRGCIYLSILRMFERGRMSALAAATLFWLSVVRRVTRPAMYGTTEYQYDSVVTNKPSIVRGIILLLYVCTHERPPRLHDARARTNTGHTSKNKSLLSYV